MTVTAAPPEWTPPEGMFPAVVSEWRRFYRDCWAKYGLAPAEYRALYLAQLGRCYICRRAKGVHPDDPKGGGGRRLAVDHNHLITGRSAVRGLLCSGSLSANTCNRLIARYDHASLQRAVQYMEESPAQALLGRMDEGAMTDDETQGWLTR
jgi:hypothetical protein